MLAAGDRHRAVDLDLAVQTAALQTFTAQALGLEDDHRILVAEQHGVAHLLVALLVAALGAGGVDMQFARRRAGRRIELEGAFGQIERSVDVVAGGGEIENHGGGGGVELEAVRVGRRHSGAEQEGRGTKQKGATKSNRKQLGAIQHD